jgi:hypothetical protein
MEPDTYSQTKLPADPNTKLSKDHCPSTQEEQDNMARIPYKSIIMFSEGKEKYITRVV